MTHAFYVSALIVYLVLLGGYIIKLIDEQCIDPSEWEWDYQTVLVLLAWPVVLPVVMGVGAFEGPLKALWRATKDRIKGWWPF
jgi:hypothetical protein